MFLFVFKVFIMEIINRSSKVIWIYEEKDFFVILVVYVLLVFLVICIIIILIYYLEFIFFLILFIKM